MPRFVRPLLVASTFAFATFALAQPPAPKPDATAPTPAAKPDAAVTTSEYFPLKVGTRWVYKIDEQRSVTVKVDKVENGEATLITESQNHTVARDTVIVKPDGVYRTKINDQAITPPLKILPLPVKKGDTWDINSKVQDRAIVGKLTVKEDKEKIKLKDGKEYECVVVDGPDFKLENSTTKMKMWFAAGKGLVKLSFEIGQQDATMELSEFTEGK